MGFLATTFTSWSFSRWTDYQQCPAKAKYKHLDKLKEPSNAAMERGSFIHTMVEDYLKGKRADLVHKDVVNKEKDVEIVYFTAELKRLKALYKKKLSGMVVEDTWAFTRTWEKTKWDDWKNCWLRVKLDCAHYENAKTPETMIVSDWKTGKFRPEQHQDYLAQLELYALAALTLFKHVKKVKPRLIYLDHNIAYPDPAVQDLEYTTRHIPILRKQWEKRVLPMMTDVAFAPRPNDKCRFCHFRKDNNGPCQY